MEQEISALAAGLQCKCPQCGKGPLFRGYLQLHDTCSACGADFMHADSGDGPAIFIMLIVGFIVVGAALVVEVSYQPPYWVHAVIWLPLILILSLGLLRPFKAILIAIQFQRKAREGRLQD